MHAGPVWLSRREPESWRIFYTERWASIKDRRLAYPSAIGWWVTLLYGLWSLIIEGGYLELDTQLRGVLRPRLNNRPAATYHENKGEFSIDRKFSPALDTDGPVPAYCTGRHLGRFPGVRTGGIRCEYWDPISASRALGPGGIFVATRVQERQEISVCQPRTSEYAIGSAIGEDMSDWGRLPGPTRPLCRDGFKQEWVRQTFLEGVDDFVLKVNGNIEAHTFAASSTVCRERLIWKHDNRELNGTLVGPAGEDICTSPPGEPDAFPLRDWLRAAGIDSLEDQTDSFETKPGLSTLRHEGMVLEVSYEYSNTQAISFSGALAARLNCEEPAPFQYKIKVKRVAGSEFKIEEVVSSEQGCDLSCPPGHTKADRSPNDPERCCGTGRVVHRLHGLLIKFEHSGTVAQFSFIAIPSYLIYALGSVTLIKSALDLVWVFVFPLMGCADYNDSVYTPAVKSPGSGNSGVCKAWKRRCWCWLKRGEATTKTE